MNSHGIIVMKATRNVADYDGFGAILPFSSWGRLATKSKAARCNS
jgi:hypothetical protein